MAVKTHVLLKVGDVGAVGRLDGFDPISPAVGLIGQVDGVQLGCGGVEGAFQGGAQCGTLVFGVAGSSAWRADGIVD